jgi:hypothetical protein
MLHIGFPYAYPVVASNCPYELHHVGRPCDVFLVGSESPCDGVLQEDSILFSRMEVLPPPPSPKSNEENTTKHYSMPYKKC